MMRVVVNVIKSLFSLILSVFRPLKRLWCRRLKASEIDPGVPVITTHSTSINVPVTLDNNDVDMNMESWDIWDGSQGQPLSPAQYSQASTGYYQATSKLPKVVTAATNQTVRGRKPEPESEPEPDYFQGMVPEVRRTAKILLKKKDNGAVNADYISSRLSVSEADVPVGADLQSWEEVENAWGEEVAEDLSWEAEAALRDKRRAERLNRTLEQQKKKQQRDSMRGLKKDSHLAVKIS